MGDSLRIQITPNLLNRLSEDGEQSKKKTKKPKPKAPKSHGESKTKVHQKNVSNDVDTQMGIPMSTPGWPLQPPLFLPISPPPPQVANTELDAIRSILQESEKVMERLLKQEEDMVLEVTQKAKELHDKEFKLPSQKPMPCSAEKDACLECYKEYAKDPLKCASVVKTFSECARKVRQQVSSHS